MRFDRVPGPSPSAGFLTFAGNTEAKERLSACIDGGRLPHALLFEGPAGSGRRTLARLTAMAAVCTGEGEKPCGVCPGCRKAAAGSHPDILEAGGEGAARSFHIDTVRALREDAYILPNEAPRRVFLLAEAQNMTEQAQNALLKILEEPPASALFLLTCENRGQLLETIRSRCVLLRCGGGDERPLCQAAGELCEAFGKGRLLPVVKYLTALETGKCRREELRQILQDCWRAAAEALLVRRGKPRPDPLCAREAAALSDRLTDRQLASLADMLAQYAGECDYNVGVGQVLGAIAVRWEELL